MVEGPGRPGHRREGGYGRLGHRAVTPPAQRVITIIISDAARALRRLCDYPKLPACVPSGAIARYGRQQWPLAPVAVGIIDCTHRGVGI